MRYLLTVILFVISSIAVADAQIHEVANGCHMPLSQTNGNKELTFTCDRAIPSQKGNGSHSGYAYFNMYGIEEFPDHLVSVSPLEENENRRVDKYNGDDGVPCNIIRRGGSVYTTQDWAATITLRRGRPGQVSIEGRLQCWNAESAESN